MRRPALLTAGAVCLTILVAACGGTARNAATQPSPERTGSSSNAIGRSTTTSTAPPSAAAIRRAASRTAREPGFRARVSASINLPQFSGNAVSAVGTGAFDPRSGSGVLNVAVGLPGLLGLAAGPLPSQVILAGHEAYVRVPTALAKDLSTSAQWLEVSPGQLDLSSLDPSTVLSQIARDATQNIPDQHARVTIDPVSGLVRTIRLTYTEPGGYRVRVTLRFTGFAAVPATHAPPAAEVGDLASVLRGLGF